MKTDQDKINEIDFHIKQKIIEALIFASAEPVPYSELKSRVKDTNVLDQILKPSKMIILLEGLIYM